MMLALQKLMVLAMDLVIAVGVGLMVDIGMIQMLPAVVQAEVAVVVMLPLPDTGIATNHSVNQETCHTLTHTECSKCLTDATLVTLLRLMLSFKELLLANTATS